MSLLFNDLIIRKVITFRNIINNIINEQSQHNSFDLSRTFFLYLLFYYIFYSFFRISSIVHHFFTVYFCHASKRFLIFQFSRLTQIHNYVNVFLEVMLKHISFSPIT